MAPTHIPNIPHHLYISVGPQRMFHSLHSHVIQNHLVRIRRIQCGLHDYMMEAQVTAVRKSSTKFQPEAWMLWECKRKSTIRNHPFRLIKVHTVFEDLTSPPECCWLLLRLCTQECEGTSRGITLFSLLGDAHLNSHKLFQLWKFWVWVVNPTALSLSILPKTSYKMNSIYFLWLPDNPGAIYWIYTCKFSCLHGDIWGGGREWLGG